MSEGKLRALARFSHRLTVEARDRRAITSLRLLAVLDGLPSRPPLVKLHAPRTDAPLTHFASPRGEKSGLGEWMRLARNDFSPDCGRKPAISSYQRTSDKTRGYVPWKLGLRLFLPACRPACRLT